jgi:RimJ/RimL family protein N-acetyltransferase
MTQKDYWKNGKTGLRKPTMADAEEIIGTIKRCEYDTEADALADELHLPHSAEGCREHWEKRVREEAKDDNCNLIIADVEGKLCGFINVFNAAPRHGGFSYGISMLPEYRGKGMAREAVTMLLDYYFNQLRYHRCGLHIYDFNPRSVRFHEKLGFQKCGQLHECHFYDGKYHDSLLYEMTAERFNEMRKQG